MLRPTRERIAWLAMTVLLGLELRYDRLRVLQPIYKATFQLDSDGLVQKELQAAHRPVLGPLLQPTGQPYPSQFGLQGMVMAALSPGDSLYGAFRVVTAFLFAAVIATAVVAVWRAWGGRAAIVLLVFLTLSTWLNAFGPSTYWQIWTMFLPILVPMLVWPRLGDGRKKWLRGGALIAGLVMLKCLCGYEYIVTILLGVTAAVAFHEFRGRFSLRFLARLGLSLAAGIVGFLAALAVHATQATILYGSPGVIRQRMMERTFSPSDLGYIFDWARGQSDPMWGWLVQKNSIPGLWAFQMAHYLNDAAITLPGPPKAGLGSGPYGIPIWMFVVVFGLLAWQAWRGRQVDAAVQRRLAVAGVIGFLGAMAWYVLFYGHMINHAHLDAVVFYLPFLPIVFAMIALRVETISRRAWPRRGDHADDHDDDAARERDADGALLVQRGGGPVPRPPRDGDLVGSGRSR